MMATTMTHAHTPAESAERSWQSCIDQTDQDHDQRAHGNVVIHEVCTCGAERFREVTLSAEHSTPWETPFNSVRE
jgi:hypothetical protein